MLVGGADGTNNPFGYMSFAKTQALSPRGRSRPFDDTGDGIALGEGIGCVVLKRLADAERDGDKIYAVVKGVGASSDGKNRSLTAPYPPGQARAVNRAYEDARVSPATVSLIEAHGTGTAVGDASELTTLTQVFEAHTFLGWVYSFDGRYDEAIDECLNAIRVDSSFGNPYNDIGSYLVAQGDLWTCVRWFRRALAAPRYESYAFPHFNLARVYEQRRRPLDAARHYGLALEEQPAFAQAAKALRRVQALLN